MAEVKGVLVTPVRNPTMPDNTSRLVSAADRCIQPESTAPTLAPVLRAGANTPPAAPVVKDSIFPPIRNSGIYQAIYLSCVNNTVVINALPDPSAFRLTK